MPLTAGIPFGADAARAFISEQIEHHKTSILSLKSAHNKLAPISRLSPELLTTVFKHVNNPNPNGIRDVDDLFRNITWKQLVRVTHVCSAWRQTSLSCPSLWSRIIFHPSKDPDKTRLIMEEMISRSKGIPLRIRVSGESMLACLDRLSPSFRRQFFIVNGMQELHVSLPPDSLQSLFARASKCYAESMHSLFIRSISPNDEQGLSDSGEDYSYSLPNHIVIPMPQLRHLGIVNCKVRWNLMQSAVSEELLSLRLCHVNQPSRSHFLHLLSQTPNLEDLHLDATFPALDPKAGHYVELPKLSSCTLRAASLSQCVDFHDHVAYPSTTARLSLWAMEVSPTTREEELTWGSHSDRILRNVLLTPFGLTADNPTRSHRNLLVTTSVGEHAEWSAILWDDPREPYPPIPSCHGIKNPQVEIHVKLPRSKDPQAFTDLLLISGLNMVAFHGMMDDLDTQAWFDFVKKHPDIKQIQAQGDSALRMFQALSTSAHRGYVPDDDTRNKKVHVSWCQVEPEQGDDFRLCLPELVHLTIKSYCAEIHKDDEDSSHAAFCAMVKFLVRRGECGAPLQVLQLIECYYIDEVVERLKEVVKVDWDGIILPEDEEDEDEEDEDEEDNDEKNDDEEDSNEENSDEEDNDEEDDDEEDSEDEEDNDEEDEDEEEREEE